MDSDKLVGLVRNLMAAIGGLILSYGLANDTTWQAMTGLTVAAIAAYYSWQAHNLTLDAVMGVVRAAVATVGGYLTFKHYATQDQISQFAAILLALVPLGWSYSAHSDRSLPPPKPPMSGRDIPVAVLIAIVLALFLVGGSAKAQTRKPVPRPVAAKSLLSGISTDAIADVTAAKVLALAQNDNVAAACYGEILTELTAQQTAQTNANLPAVHLFYSFQVARGRANAALPTSTLNTACAPLAQQVKMSVLTLVNGLVTGGLGPATIGPLFGLP